MIESDIGDTLYVIVSGDGDDGDGEVEMPGRVDGDEAVDGAFQKHSWVFVDEIGAMAMAGDEIEVTLLQEIVFDSAHDGGGIAVADFGDDDSDGEAALGTQGAGEEIGTILEFAGGGEDAVFGVLRDGIGDAGSINDEGDGGGGEVKVLREFFEAHGPAGGVRCLFCYLFLGLFCELELLRGHAAESRTTKSGGQGLISLQLMLYY